MFDFLKSLIGLKSSTADVTELKKESKKTSRGRPKKVAPEVVEVPKKRGRPKKVVEVVAEPIIEPVVIEIVEPVKKTRGRPRKK